MGGLLSRALHSWRNWYNTNDADPWRDKLTQAEAQLVIDAVQKGDLNTLKDLVNELDDLEFVCKRVPLVLHATVHGQVKIVKYLLEELGADANVADACGMTALHEASKHKRYKCLELLLLASHDLNKRDVWGRTPLMKAVVYRNVHAARKLLERGADPNVGDIYGLTALITAVDYNMLDVIKMLVHHGADMNLITQHHHHCCGPALYRAINNQDINVVRELLLLGAATRPIQKHLLRGSLLWGSFSLAQAYLTSSLGSSTPPALHHEEAVSLAMAELVKRSDQLVTATSLNILMEVLDAHGESLGSQPEVLARVMLSGAGRSHLLGSSPLMSSEEPRLVEPEHEDSFSEGSTGGDSFSNRRSPTLTWDNFTDMLLLKLHLCSSGTHEPLSLKSMARRHRHPETIGFDRVVGDLVVPDSDDIPRYMEVDDIVNFPLTGRPRIASLDGMTRRQRLSACRKKVLSLHTLARRSARRALMESGCNVVWAVHRLAIPPALKTLLLLRDIDRAYAGCQIKTNLQTVEER